MHDNSPGKLWTLDGWLIVVSWLKSAVHINRVDLQRCISSPALP